MSDQNSNSVDAVKTPPGLLLRIENWLTADDRAVLRRTIAPAIIITTPTVKPIELPSWNLMGHIVNVRALRGNAFLEIGGSEDPADYDPAGRGRLLLEGESDRWLVWPESYLSIRLHNHSGRTGTFSN